MSQPVVIILNAQDEFSEELLKLIEQLGKTKEETEGVGKEQEEATRIQKAWTAATKGGALALGGLTLAAGLGVAAITGLVKAGHQLLEVWREQEAVNTGLTQALARAGVAQDELSDRVAAYSKVAGEAAATTMFGDEDVFRGLTTFINLTGQAEVSTSQLNVILGIASARKIDTAQASEIYGKALKGEVGPLKDITSLTKEQEAELNSMTNTTARAARVQAILTAAFGGLAAEINPTFNAIKNLEDVTGDLQQAMGGMIDTSGALPAVLSPITAELRSLEAWIGKNERQSRLLVIAFLDGLVVAIDELVVAGAEGVKILIALEKGGELMALGFSNAVEFVKILGNGLIAFVTGAVAGALKELEDLARDSAQLANLIGAEELGAKLERGARALTSMRTSAEGVIAEKFADIEKSTAKIDINISKGADALLEYVSAADKVDAGLVRVRKTTASIRAGLAKARKDVEAGKISKTPVTATGKGVKAQSAALSAAAAARKAAAQALARLELKALKEQDAVKKAMFERDVALKQISIQKLAGAQKELAVTKAQLDLAAKLKEINIKARQDAAGAQSADLQLKALVETNAERAVELEYRAKLIELNAQEMTGAERLLAMERLRREEAEARGKAVAEEGRASAEALTTMATRLRAVGAANDDVERTTVQLAGLADLVSKVQRHIADVQEGTATAGDAAVAALGSSAGVLGGVFDALGASTGQQAILQGLFAQAQAGLALFTGDPLRAAGLQAVAVAHFAVAAKAGEGGASSSSITATGGLSGGGSGDTQTSRPEDSARMAAEQIGAEVARALGTSDGATVINFNGGFYGANAEVELTNMIDREQTRRGRGR